MFRLFSTSMIAITLCLLLGLQATAADETARAKWRYDDGQFEQGQGKNWIETFDNGGNCYFQEVSRNRDYIEIYDKSRDIAVRLYKTKMYLKQPNSNTFDYFRDGKWID